MIRNTKLFPLLLSSLVLTLVFLPEFLRQLTITVDAIEQDGFRLKDYDTVIAAFIAVVLFMIALFIVIVAITCQYYRQLKKLNPR